MVLLFLSFSIFVPPASFISSYFSTSSILVELRLLALPYFFVLIYFYFCVAFYFLVYLYFCLYCIVLHCITWSSSNAYHHNINIQLYHNLHQNYQRVHHHHNRMIQANLPSMHCFGRKVCLFSK